MGKINFTVGFTIGVLFVYFIGTIVAWDVNPGNWNFWWRLWCFPWVIFWGLSTGVFFAEHTLLKKKRSNVVVIDQRR